MHWLCCSLLLSGIKTIFCSEPLSPNEFISFFHHVFFNSHCPNQHQDFPPQMLGNEMIVQGQNHKIFKEILRSLRNKMQTISPIQLSRHSEWLISSYSLTNRMLKERLI